MDGDVQQSRVLIHAPFGRDGTLISDVLERASIRALACQSVESLCAALKLGAGAILIADEALRPQNFNALRDVIGNQPTWSDIPVFIMTARRCGDQPLPSRLRLFESLGNITVLERPLSGETIISSFRMALRARAHQYQIRDHLDSERAAAEALRESEERYRTLAEALPQLVWTALCDGRCDYLSTQWLEYTGVPPSEQLGFGWLDIVHPEDREHVHHAWMTATADRGPYDIEYRLRRHDGAYRWVKARATALRNSNGAIQRWFGTCTDIEETKRASEERQLLLAREQQARKVAELLNQVGPMLSAELDLQQLTQKITDLATQLTGAEFGAFFYNVRNEVGESYVLYTLSGVPREAFEGFPMPRNTAVFGPTFNGEGIVRSADITRDPRYGKNAPNRGMPPGHLPVRSYLAAPVVSRSGVLGGLFFGSPSVGVFTEVHEQLAEGIAAQAAIALDNARLFSELQSAKADLERSNAELRRANDDLNQFAYSASHDLREPLRMVAIYSQILQRRYHHLLDEQGAQYLAYAVQGAKRMELLISDLLAYTQAVDVSPKQVVPVDASRAFDQACQNLKNSIEESKATVRRTDLPTVMVQEVHLLQLFQNLIGNAIKYRAEAPPEVHVSAEKEGTLWKFCVQDNGIGFDPQYAQQVFGLFKRLHGGDSQYEGTGIGLAICQKIVDRYGGRIWAESKGPGQGCLFCFTLPGVDAAEKALG